MNLYELTENYRRACEDLMDQEDLSQDAVDNTLEGLMGPVEDKILNVAKHFLNLESESTAIEVAIHNMISRRKALIEKISYLKKYIMNGMDSVGIDKVRCPEFELKMASNPPSVEVNEGLLPSEYYSTMEVSRADKKMIREAINGGVKVPGAFLVSGKRLVIK